MLLALDLDGTLLTTDKRLTARNLDAITRAQDAGTTIVLASGRHPYSMSYFAELLHLRERGGYLLAFNGAQLFDYSTSTEDLLHLGDLLFSQQLPHSVLHRLRDWARHYNLPMLSFIGNTIISEQPDNPYVVENARNNRMPIEGVDDLATVFDNRPAPPKYLLPGDPTLLPEVEAAMKADLAGEIDIYRSAPHYLELVPLGIDKGRTLLRLLEHLHLTPADLVACGDQDNDIPMLRVAGIGVAMGNAAENVKAAADYIAPSCDDDGVAHVVERFLLKDHNDNKAYKAH